MDELQKLKKLWDQSQSVPQKKLNEKDLKEILRRKSQNPIEKLKRNLKIEIIITFLMLPVLAYIAFVLQDLEYVIYSSILGLIAITGIFYYINNLKSLDRQWKHAESDLKSSMEKSLAQLGIFKKLYFRINLILFPVGIYLGYMLGFGLANNGQKPNIEDILDLGTPVLIILSLFIVFMTALGVGILYWYVKGLYGNHLDKLETILKELEENTE